tara:strand:- start:72 stop:377 length:306 start_codon:yes stop_codon:yes gene_type:complete
MEFDKCCSCDIWDNIEPYECSSCRLTFCQNCCINDVYLLCKCCDVKFKIGELKEKDINWWLVKCENCGNIWDGNAQCSCLGYDFSFIESESEPESEPESDL